MSAPHPLSIAGFVPAYNAAATIGEAVRSLLEQVPAPLEVLVIDDGSTDDTACVAERAGARVVRMPSNSGRGAVRARAMELLDADLIVSLDAGNRAAPDFVAKALPCFTNIRVAAVVGHWSAPESGCIAERWRSRHLYKVARQATDGEERALATHACVLRRSAVLAAGNFDPALRHTEDAVLGLRLRNNGLRIVACPAAQVMPLELESLPALARRYWRWHAGPSESWSPSRYFNSVKNALFVMLPLDRRARDLPSALFTLLLPHWLALYTLGRRLRRKVQT
jgi:cellulose synthase/poly-beta-1,6-N-acetylglucosamine synthase-like glycosyltransferase